MITMLCFNTCAISFIFSGYETYEQSVAKDMVETNSKNNEFNFVTCAYYTDKYAHVIWMKRKFFSYIRYFFPRFSFKTLRLFLIMFVAFSTIIAPFCFIHYGIMQLIHPIMYLVFVNICMFRKQLQNKHKYYYEANRIHYANYVSLQLSQCLIKSLKASTYLSTSHNICSFCSSSLPHA